MTQADTRDSTDVPQFKAADEQVSYADLNWFQRILRKYTNSFSVARSSLFWALLRRQKRTLKWLFIVLIIYTVGLPAGHEPHAGHGRQRDRRTRSRRLWPYVRYITFWALWSMVFSLAQQQIADRLAYQIEFDMRVWLYTHIQSADLRRLDQVATGQLVTRSLTDIQLVDTLLQIVPDAHRVRCRSCSRSAIIVTIISPIMGVLAILALPINLWLLSQFRARLPRVELGGAQRARRGHHAPSTSRCAASGWSRRSAAKTRSAAASPTSPSAPSASR